MYALTLGLMKQNRIYGLRDGQELSEELKKMEDSLGKSPPECEATPEYSLDVSNIQHGKLLNDLKHYLIVL